jgi:methionyl-tRNA formyltransferase
MKKEIDAGSVLAQKEVEIQKEDTIGDLYAKCYAISVDVLLAALEKVRREDFTPYVNNRKASYFSFPEKEHWRQFRERGGKFI